MNLPAWFLDPPLESWLPVAEQLTGSILLVALLSGLWSLRRALRSRDLVIVVLLVALALGLRFIAHAGPSDIRAVLDEHGNRRAGWAAMVQLVYDLLPARDESMWALNRVVGGFSVALLYVVMRRRFSDPLAAIGGAATLAVTPLIARFSATDTPYILLCAAFLAALIAYDHYVESGSEIGLALAFGLLAIAMQLRPETPWLVVPAALLTIGNDISIARLRQCNWLRPSLAIVLPLFLLTNLIPILWSMKKQIASLGGGFVLIGSVMGSPWADPGMTPRALTALVLVGALCALRAGRSGWLWLTATLIAQPLQIPATSWLSFGPVYMGGIAFHAPLSLAVPITGQYASARYHLPSMYLACGLAGLAICALVRLLASLTSRRLPAPGLIAIAIACAAASGQFELLRRTWTPQQEFELFRSGLGLIDPHCRVVAFKDTNDLGFMVFDYLVPGGVLDVKEVLDRPPSSRCLIYYRAGNCYTLDLVPASERPGFEIHPLCRAIEEQFRLEPILEQSVPALSFRGEVYVRNPLPLGFYRLQDLPAHHG